MRALNGSLWGHTYDGDLADFFAIQSEIAMAIAEELHAKLSPNERSEIEQSRNNRHCRLRFLHTRQKIFS